MARSKPKTLILAGGTAFSAFAIGYVMQFGIPGFGGPQGPVTVSAVTDTSAPKDIDAAMVETPDGTMAVLPVDGASADALPAAPVELAAISSDTLTDARPPVDAPSAGFGCEINAKAEATAGAMVALSVSAPCHGAERVTIHHNGLMFTETVQPDGTLALDVPALSEQAVFILSFASGDGAVAQTEVPSLAFYDRVALQWRGESGLQLHAREMGAEYFAEGHVWQGAPGSVAAAAKGEGGFFTTLGDPAAPEARMAEVYSFPRGTAQRAGEIALTVEAEVSAMNCAADIEAQTLEYHKDQRLTVQDLILSIPDCDAVGDFLVLDDMVSDIAVAAR